MDPYVVLGVEPGVGPDEIDAAYTRRVRLHDPDRQETDADREAARRYRSELGDAYRALLGVAAPAAPGAAGEHGVPATARPAAAATRAARGEPSPGRDWLVVLGAVVVAYVVLQVPAAFGFGFGGVVVGWLAALAVIIFTLVKVRARRR